MPAGLVASAEKLIFSFRILRRSAVILTAEACDKSSTAAFVAKGFQTAAALGTGAPALNAAGNLNAAIAGAMGNLTDGALDFTAADSCVLTCAATLGPCSTNVNLVRRDITSGIEGMPLRLAFRIVNADPCEPVAGRRPRRFERLARNGRPVLRPADFRHRPRGFGISDFFDSGGLSSGGGWVKPEEITISRKDAK